MLPTLSSTPSATSFLQGADSGALVQPAASGSFVQPAASGSSIQPAGGVPPVGASLAAPPPAGPGPAGPTAADIAVQQAAQAAAQQKALQQTSINNQINTWTNLEKQAASQNAADYRGTALNFVNALQQGQLGINQDRENTMLNKQISIQDLINHVRAGISGGQIGLGNMNALNSSAAEGLARAYGSFGAQQNNSIGAQANQALTLADEKQAQLDTQQQQDLGQLTTMKNTYIKNIGNDILTRLNSVDAEAQAYGLDPIDVAGMKQSIIDDANSKLGDIDNWIQTMTNPTTNPALARTTNDQAAGTAYQSYTKGIIPPNMGLFDFNRTPAVTTTPPAGAPGGPSPVAGLPLFTNPVAA